LGSGIAREAIGSISPRRRPWGQINVLSFKNALIRNLNQNLLKNVIFFLEKAAKIAYFFLPPGAGYLSYTPLGLNSFIHV